MDLLGDIGQTDQLTSAREENRVLQAKVKEMTIRIHELMAENQALKAEVEMYRNDYRNGSGIYGGESKEALVGYGMEGKESYDSNDSGTGIQEGDDYVTSGSGIYPTDPAATLPQIHGKSNPLCCALHPDDSLLATGGADSTLNLCRWGSALAPGDESSEKAVNEAIKIGCGAPVICTSFMQMGGGRGCSTVAAGCMDGKVRLVYSGLDMGASTPSNDRILQYDEDDGLAGTGIQHKKYVKNICWHPSQPIVATASADGTVQLTKIKNLESMMAAIETDGKPGLISAEVVQSMHFDAPVESMCFLNGGDTLCCYVRGTSYLSYFDLKEGGKQRKVSLNGGSTGTGGFDDHVSFAVLSLLPSPHNEGKYLAAATDSHRNIILESGTDRIVRNLYGHKNDGYSNPKIAWSSNGQYLYGNAQDESHICVWDIASSNIVKRLDEGMGGHAGFVRDIFSSAKTDTVATVSFDKSAKVWLNSM